jgi:hypothetical protein
MSGALGDGWFPISKVTPEMVWPVISVPGAMLSKSIAIGGELAAALKAAKALKKLTPPAGVGVGLAVAVGVDVGAPMGAKISTVSEPELSLNSQSW